MHLHCHAGSSYPLTCIKNVVNESLGHHIKPRCINLTKLESTDINYKKSFLIAVEFVEFNDTITLLQTNRILFVASTVPLASINLDGYSKQDLCRNLKASPKPQTGVIRADSFI